MEIKSPGPLLSTLSIEDLNELEGAHESRNALIATVLRENKFMRELGEGMKRIFRLMEESELDKPKLFSNSTWFKVMLPHKSVYSPQQLHWLKLFESFDLTRNQKKIVVLGMAEREISQEDIYNAMNTENRDIYDREVTVLRNAGILVQIRTNRQGTLYARLNRISKRKVPRFKIQSPQSKQDQPPISGVNPDSRIFITKLPSSITTQTVEQTFKMCGEIKRVDLPMDPVSGASKGFGFVWFNSPASARKAIKELNGVEIDGCRIIVKKYIPKTNPG